MVKTYFAKRFIPSFLNPFLKRPKASTIPSFDVPANIFVPSVMVIGLSVLFRMVYDCYEAVQGSTSFSPVMPEKSLVFRVASARPAVLAIAAI